MRVTDNMRSWNPVTQTTGWDGPGIGEFSHLLQIQIPVLINAQTRGEKAKHFHYTYKSKWTWSRHPIIQMGQLL